MKTTLLLLLSAVFVISCSKEEDPGTKNVFYEIASPAGAKFHVTVTDGNKNVTQFDSVTTGWNWQKQTEIGRTITIEAVKQTMLDRVTIDFFRLNVFQVDTQQVIDTGKVKTITLWSKVSE